MDNSNGRIDIITQVKNNIVLILTLITTLASTLVLINFRLSEHDKILAKVEAKQETYDESQNTLSISIANLATQQTFILSELKELKESQCSYLK